MESVPNKKFYFARHGKTDWNDKQLCQGQFDIELNETGRLEARLLAESINAYPFSRICVSPLKRAMETARIIQAMQPKCQLQIIDELKERSWGELEGASSAEMYRFEELEEKNPQINSERGIEHREAFKTRILKGLNIALQQNDEPLIISHGRVFLCLCELLSIPLIRQIPNTTLIECLPTKQGWKIT